MPAQVIGATDGADGAHHIAVLGAARDNPCTTSQHESRAPMRVLPLLALGFALCAGAAQAQLAQFCNGRISLVNVTLDPRSVSDGRRPWLYSGSFTNSSGGAINTILTFMGPAGTISQAHARSLSMSSGSVTQTALVQWPKSMGQPNLSTVAAGVRVECL